MNSRAVIRTRSTVHCRFLLLFIGASMILDASQRPACSRLCVPQVKTSIPVIPSLHLLQFCLVQRTRCVLPRPLRCLSDQVVYRSVTRAAISGRYFAVGKIGPFCPLRFFGPIISPLRYAGGNYLGIYSPNSLLRRGRFYGRGFRALLRLLLLFALRVVALTHDLYLVQGLMDRHQADATVACRE